MRTLLFGFALVVLTAACGPTAPATGTVEITSALLTDPGNVDALRLDLELANGTADTAYVIDRVRSVFHDAATSTTRLWLHDQPCKGDLNDAHYVTPTETKLEARSYRTITLELPAHYGTVGPTGEVDVDGLPVATAAHVVIEIAWSDVRFDLTPAEGMNACMADAIIARERGIATATATRAP